MQRLLDVSQTALDLLDNPDEVINVKPSTRRTRNDRHATRSQAERLNNLPRHSNFFLRLRSKRDTNRVANSFVQQNPETDRRFHRSTERSSGFRDAKMKRVIALPSQQSIRRDCPMHVRSFQRNDNVSEIEILEDLNMPQC